MVLVFTWPEGSATLSFSATYGYLRDLQRSELTAMPSFHWKSTSLNTAAQASREKQYTISVFRLVLVSVLVTGPGNSFICAGRQQMVKGQWRKQRAQAGPESRWTKQNVKGTEVSSRCIKMWKVDFCSTFNSSTRHTKWAFVTFLCASCPTSPKTEMGATVVTGVRGTQGNHPGCSLPTVSSSNPPLQWVVTARL